jgi:hypothetical protein
VVEEIEIGDITVVCRVRCKLGITNWPLAL